MASTCCSRAQSRITIEENELRILARRLARAETAARPRPATIAKLREETIKMKEAVKVSKELQIEHEASHAGEVER